jgi:retron-type reverse transcriptase
VEIPKPDGGVRKLGIPTVLDRFIQQAVMQVLQRRWNPTFSEHSHGFRPKRSAHQAVAKAQQYIAAGHRWVVDLDLEKFFDRVNHDKLMAAISRRVTDKRVLRLIGAFLKVGVLENGLVSPAEEGTPQGGPYEQPHVISRCSAMATSATRLNLDGLVRCERRRTMCSGTSSATDATNHKLKFELLDYPVAPIVDSILGAVLLCM